jgi:hypothetical protein
MSGTAAAVERVSTTFSYFAPTPAALAKLSIVIPGGYSQVYLPGS